MTTSSAPITAAILALAGALSAPFAGAQSQVLFEDHFEAPSDNWGSMPGLWHVADAGECGAASGMAAVNDPATCSYDAGGPYSVTLISEPFFLSGSPPYTVQFDHMVDFDDADTALLDRGTFAIVRANPPSFVQLGSWNADNEVDTLTTHTNTFSAGWQGAFVTLQWSFHASGSRDAGLGWWLDNVSVTNSGGWTDLGNGLAGVAGEPTLSLSGTLEAGAPTTLVMIKGHPLSATALVLGLARLNAPFKGGVLVPKPDLLVPLVTNAAGYVGLDFSFPAGVPAGTPLIVQCWVEDPTNPQGWSASAAQMTETP